jgi:hypothetical protein
MDQLLQNPLPEQLPALLARLAEQLALLAASLAAPAPTAPASTASGLDRMLTAKEVAERLRCSTKSIYRRVGTFPFARRNGGRTWIFSEQGLTKCAAGRRNEAVLRHLPEYFRPVALVAFLTACTVATVDPPVAPRRF